MAIESRRNQEKFGAKSIEGWKYAAFHGRTEFLRSGIGRKGRVADVAHARFAGGTGSRIERHLVGRGVKGFRIALEHGLGAVAVMDVEIDDGHTPQPMYAAGLMRTHRDIVEQAETHGGSWLGVMAGRANGAKGVGDLAGDDGIHRRADRAGSPK